MNLAYKNWKENIENEFKEYREANYRLVYRYQTDYDYYLNSPDGVQVGDFCNFHRRGTLHIPEQIYKKYEKLMLDNINIFSGFCKDEFDRIRVWLDYENSFEKSKKIFEYSGGFKVRYEDLTTNQKWVFNQELEAYLKEHEEDIELFKKLDKKF